MFKRIITLLFVATITALMLMACGSDPTPEPETVVQEQSVEKTPEPTPEVQIAPDCELRVTVQFWTATLHGRDMLLGETHVGVYEFVTEYQYTDSSDDRYFSYDIPDAAEVVRQTQEALDAYVSQAAYISELLQVEGITPFRVSADALEDSWLENFIEEGSIVESPDYYFCEDGYLTSTPDVYFYGAASRDLELRVRDVTESRLYMSMLSAGSRLDFWLPRGSLVDTSAVYAPVVMPTPTPKEGAEYAMLSMGGGEIAAMQVDPADVNFRWVVSQLLPAILRVHRVDADYYVTTSEIGTLLGVIK